MNINIIYLNYIKIKYCVNYYPLISFTIISQIILIYFVRKITIADKIGLNTSFSFINLLYLSLEYRLIRFNTNF